jgi:hypothetical protein
MEATLSREAIATFEAAAQNEAADRKQRSAARFSHPAYHSA